MTPHRHRYDVERIALADLSGRKWHRLTFAPNRHEKRFEASEFRRRVRRNNRLIARMNRGLAR